MHTTVHFGTLLLLLAYLGTATSCVSQEQRYMVMGWYDASDSAVKLQKHMPPALMNSAALTKQIGSPDQRVPASLLDKTLPYGWGADVLRRTTEERQRQLVSSGLSQGNAAQEVGISEFWLYDESARNKLPSQPDSFWGMGTGFQVVWFAVYKDQVIASGGFGLGNTRRLTDH